MSAPGTPPTGSRPGEGGLPASAPAAAATLAIRPSFWAGRTATVLLQILTGVAILGVWQLAANLEVVSRVLLGEPVAGINTAVGYVTQDSNLYPWMTLRQNVEFPLEIRGVPARERRERADEYIAMVGLEGFEGHYPYQLSGGMQKRGSIIRTMIYDPSVILMDEPFGPLDAQTRMVLQAELLRISRLKQQTILFITHDLTEAIALSDVVVVMSARPGRIKQVFDIPLAHPRDVFQIHAHPGFAEIYAEIWDCFRSEVLSQQSIRDQGATEVAS